MTTVATWTSAAGNDAASATDVVAALPAGLLLAALAALVVVWLATRGRR